MQTNFNEIIPNTRNTIRRCLLMFNGIVGFHGMHINNSISVYGSHLQRSPVRFHSILCLQKERKKDEEKQINMQLYRYTRNCVYLCHLKWKRMRKNFADCIRSEPF